ncbi:Folylpolyglutamate synthase [Sulfurovum sp. enrichment culture clone C5]|uniref:Folylpolyglutamate synthase n=1 Tax=Sulfurovum sp. enrichment culture clone C5 TaxID=497650 RepID=A0A0S4XP02_9BACT|nr:Folylpolyglutamate synthase [Sulfurovum sp. enrichment culture clone C5]
MTPKLELFLNSKPLYYKHIDYNRIKVAFDIVKKNLKLPKIIHIVGTNGKGSTGRMVAHLLLNSGFNTAHYTSPHILKFNERFWLNGDECSDDILEIAHKRLYEILDDESRNKLSYFEYTTLLALFAFEECEYLVLEAGLGGENDATNVVSKTLSIITPIDFDHQAFLGERIEDIATTKINSIDKIAVVGMQPHLEVVDVAKKIAKGKNTKLVFVASDYQKEKITQIAKQNRWGDFLCDNAKSACVALDTLGIKYDINSLNSWQMMGRYFAYSSNVRLDVGHNTLAANALVKVIEDDTILIYNTYEDKPYREILRLLKPKIKKLLIIPIDSPRAVNLEKLETTLKELEIDYGFFDNKIDSDKKYLVFGSFSVVEAFLKEMSSK